MDRVIIYPGQIPLETDLLQSNKNAMIALSKLAAAVLGASTLVNGLAVVPTGPASLNVSVGPGEIYSLQNIDNGAYSSLAADTAHQIVKQGIMLDAKNLACPAPATVGQSINYLVQAAYADTDSGNVVLPYYNASNSATAYSGPGNSGAAQSTMRQGLVTVVAKAGAAAATGSQATPAPDAGYVGLYVVTVANGQTTINSGQINPYVGAPIISERLGDKISQATADARYARGSVLQPGDIVDVAGNILPANRMWCPISPTNVSRTTYAALFAAIGTTWGAGDGSTTFGLPYFPPDYAGLHANGNVGTSTVGQVISHVHGSASGNGFWVDQPGLYTVTAGGATANLNIAPTTASIGGSANLAAGMRIRKSIIFQ
ncbi:tail fiber protein [Herbaspirillum sp. YR522]|uniref:tail fiber protein n=1 Tax=Herbaspirillum sp. YR522 TaxID=1144342 RepID=UPI00026F7647|nr:tail fiber protein [Herbaspirillum sp. YR522]EJN09397.1 microcystin-dependent protein [Herbaspirillum sp. YR522]